MDYAIIATGGKQYRVAPGDRLDVEKLPAEPGAKIELTDVLMVSQDGKVTVGAPMVPGAKVVAEVEEQRRGEKLVVFKFKAKTRHGVKTGHRQSLTRLRITEIVPESALADTRPRQEETDGA
ncbi:MAG: 50S ribosomal protein L21 [Chloroflexi bacterium]|nr:50S ribosomal protein L21 [Chloroflexota bacterium]